MSRTIHIDIFDPASVDAAVQEIREYSAWVQRKAQELAKRLADMGAVLASIEYSRVPYTGEKLVDIAVNELDSNRYAITASGETVLILEFGAGIKYGHGHPLEGSIGMGAGTYPGQKHALSPYGWWLPKEKGGDHTYGNPPAMAMYLTGKELRERVLEVAKEVFGT